MTFAVLNNDFGAELFLEVVLIVNRHPRIVIGEDRNAFWQVRFYLLEIDRCSKPMLVSCSHFGIVFKSGQAFEKAANKNGPCDFFAGWQRFQIAGNGLAAHAVPDKKGVLVSSANGFRKL